MVRVKEEPAAPDRIAQQQRHRSMTRHRASRSLKHLLRDTASLVGHQHHVIGVDTPQGFGLLGTRRPRGDKRLGIGILDLDAVLLGLKLVRQHRRQYLHPALDLREERVIKLAARRRRHDNLHREPQEQIPQHRPGRRRGLAHAMTTTHADAPVARRDVVQKLHLPRVRRRVQHLAHKENRVLAIPIDELDKRVLLQRNF